MHNIVVRAALLATTFSIAAPPPTLGAQDIKPPARGGVLIRPEPLISLLWSGAADRAVLGVTMAASSAADTAGVRLQGVDANSPAAKAGLKVDDVITDINGVSLRVSAIDAEELAQVGIAQRRLQRTMAKAKPGDEVVVRVRSGGNSRVVKVKTVSAAELDGARERRAPGVPADGIRRR